MSGEFTISKPSPPDKLLEGYSFWFSPSPDLKDWAIETFVSGDGSLVNEDHNHLMVANIGFLWTNVENRKRGRMVIGTAEMGTPQGAMSKWGRARIEQQTQEWFGTAPDFIITIDATWWVQASDAECCALIEHELYHCAQERDEFGSPKFNQHTGRPIFGMRGHDVEQFVGVVRRYGSDASGVREMIEAANAGPEIAAADISHACGNCLQRAA